MASSMFYLGFILGAYPVTFLAQRFPIERVASLAIIVWGTTLILTPACTNFQGLYAQRFFLGFTEAGISPIFMMIVVRILYHRRQTILAHQDSGWMVQKR
jgi:MFS family permease